MKIIKITAIMLCVLMFAASCGKKEPEPAPAPSPAPGGGTEDITGDIPEDSILLFKNDEGAAKLIKDMEEGRIPTECRAMYDEMGARPEVLMTDPEQVTEAYRRLSQMTIGGPSDWSITDCYHYISFTLQDGTKVGWHFESADLLCWGSENYEVTNTGTVWGMVRELQESMGAEE